MVTILFLAANPLDTTPLRIDEEVRAIDEKLRWAEFRDMFEIKQHWAVRIADLQEYLLRHRPHIVHFSGHGSRSSEIILQDSLGKSQSVSVQALSGLFSILKDNIRCVILNSCYSEGQAQAIANHIDCVVGMSNTITDSSAISFAASFYQALGYGRSVRTAFDLGCAQIDLAGLGEQETPKLLARRHDPKGIFFVPSREVEVVPTDTREGIPYVVCISGSSYERDTSTLCNALGIALAKYRYRIISGGGPGAGIDVSRAAYEYLMQYYPSFAETAITFVYTPKRKETLIPFGQVIDVPNVETLREKFVRLGWGFVFIGGDKGTWEEYQELKRYMLQYPGISRTPIALGCTGGVARKIWAELLPSIDKLYGGSITPEDFAILNDENVSIDSVITVVMRILNTERRSIH